MYFDVARGRVTDPADEAAYTVADAARFLHIPISTLRFWVRGGHYQRVRGGRGFSKPVLQLAEPDYLSFKNLAEAYVLRGLRLGKQGKQMTMPAVRESVAFLAKELKDPHPLVHPDVRICGAELLAERYGKLISASAPGQYAIREAISAHLARLRWKHETVNELFPFVLRHEGIPAATEPRIVRISPGVAYGRPVLGNGVRTSMIIERFEAGDGITALAEDYETSREDIEEAIRYERVGASYLEAA